ncbi:MAG: damage-inducible protein DinB [Rhodospirillales bacterium]|jgi:uncharacterized damage-inducible protein DinB|nr:damage-inducible protein DinB [Rhodospirillales bacterium]
MPEKAGIIPVTDTPYFRAQAYNNAWANYRLLSACAELSSEELSAQRTNFFPTIIQTLNHNLTVDWYYVSALEGNCIGAAAYDPENPYQSLADIEKEQRAVDRRLIAVCEGLNEARLPNMIDMPRNGWIQTEPFSRILLHLLQHQIHHRGQVHAMLAGTNVAPPQLDEFFLGHKREQALREQDFKALKFDEGKIWR